MGAKESEPGEKRYILSEDLKTFQPETVNFFTRILILTLESASTFFTLYLLAYPYMVSFLFAGEFQPFETYL